MENASKALLIAGGVLIAILIVTLGVTLYTTYSRQAKSYNAIVSTVEIQKYNSNFDVYVGRTDIKPQEIVSVVNLAKENKYDVQIYLNNQLLNYTTSEEFIKEYFADNELKTFKCESKTTGSKPNPEYDNMGKIIKLYFKENT